MCIVHPLDVQVQPFCPRARWMCGLPGGIAEGEYRENESVDAQRVVEDGLWWEQVQTTLLEMVAQPPSMYSALRLPTALFAGYAQQVGLSPSVCYRKKKVDHDTVFIELNDLVQTRALELCFTQAWKRTHQRDPGSTQAFFCGAFPKYVPTDLLRNPSDFRAFVHAARQIGPTSARRFRLLFVRPTTPRPAPAQIRSPCPAHGW